MQIASADAWYRTVSVEDGITLIEEPHIKPFFRCNLASMSRIIDLPVRVVHGGHFPSFDGARYRQLIRGYLDLHGR